MLDLSPDPTDLEIDEETGGYGPRKEAVSHTGMYCCTCGEEISMDEFLEMTSVQTVNECSLCKEDARRMYKDTLDGLDKLKEILKS